MSKLKSLRAEFKGGVFNGLTFPLAEPYPTVIHFVEFISRSGETIRQEGDKYKLVSQGEVLKYEIENPN